MRRSSCRVTLCGAGRRLRRAPEPQPRRDRLTVRRTRAGNTSRACESLTQTIRELHDQACIEAAGATAVRRTFGVRLDMLRSPGPDSVVTMLYAKKLAAEGGDELVMGEFGNEGDAELVW